MNEHNDSIEKQFPEGTFRGLFWQEQLKAAKVKDARQMRWHPTMIKWCLNLKLLSSSAYHSLRTGGFIKLPSERTLREYTHYFKSKTGFQAEVDQMLTEEVSLHGSSEWQSYLVILFDEMKVRESLVYDKHTCELIGFTKLGDLNDQLDLLERSDVEHPTIANHILGVMVRGVFTSLRFPYAHFPTTDTTGAKLYSIVWEAIERLERLQLKVVAVTADGASPNRKFFSMHSCSKSDVCYKTPNPYTKEDRHIYFFSDVPHLMKTTRNCWSHSFSNNNTRKLWINGQHISWTHLMSLYDAKISLAEKSQGLYLLKKLSKEHIHLTSYSRMRVDLAAEVLSTTVAEGLSMYGGPESTETQRFVRNFDKFFDCLNVRSPDEHQRRRKPNLKPYTSPADERLIWLEKDFLGYLKEWETSVDEREDLTSAQKATMKLSRETLDGLHITVRSFCELTRYLLGFEMAKTPYLLSEHFSQDPIENYFGQQRSQGGWSQNPTVQACLTSAQSLRVQGSLAMMPLRGNSRRKKRLFKDKEEVIDDKPLPKRPRKK